MWLTTKRYDDLWQAKYDLQKEKDLLIRILSGVVINQGGVITISMPSSDSRTLSWIPHEDGTLTITSKIYGLEEKELST